MDNVKEIIDSGICVGCGICAQTCPTNALQIRFDNKIGIYQASLNTERCSNCGLCVNVCPFVTRKQPETEKIYPKVFLSFSKNENLRYKAASGGSISQILITLLKLDIIDGALIVRSQKSRSLTYEYYIATNRFDILNSKGSLYAPVSAYNIPSLLRNVPNDFRLAFIGLPCIISGLHKLKQLEPSLTSKVVLKIGLFCGRMPNMFATEYLLHKLKINSDSVLRINYRDAGWPGNITIYLKNGDKVEVPYESNLGMKTLFSSSLFLPKSCYFCNDALAVNADISGGDAWLKRLRNNKVGYSIVLSLSNKGEEILSKVSNDLYLEEITKEELFEAQKRIIRSKDTGYKHRMSVYLLLNHRLNHLIQISDLKFSLLVFFREIIFMPIYLTISNMNLSNKYHRISFYVIYLLKLVDKAWR